MSVYLGIDIGTSGTKTLAIRENGRIIAGATFERSEERRVGKECRSRW